MQTTSNHLFTPMQDNASHATNTVPRFIETDQTGQSPKPLPVNLSTMQACPELDTFLGSDSPVGVALPSTTQSSLLVNQVLPNLHLLHQGAFLNQDLLLQPQQSSNQYYPPMSSVSPYLPSLYANPSSRQPQHFQFPQHAYSQQNGIPYHFVSPGDITTNAQLPHSEESTLIGAQLLGQPTLSPLNVEGVNYGGVACDPQALNTITNGTEVPSTNLNSSFQRAGTKRRCVEALQNTSKRHRTLVQVEPLIDSNGGGNKAIHNMNAVKSGVHGGVHGGVLLSTNTYKGYVYKYVMLNDAKHCSRCEKRFATQEQLKKHMKGAHTVGVAGSQQDKGFVCPVCKDVLKSWTNLCRHGTNVHRDGERHECLKCDAWFSTAHSLAKHMNRAHEMPSKENKGTQRRKAVKSGIVEIGKDRLKVYVCGCCDEVHDTPANIKRHIDLTHLKKRDFECDVCGRWFKTKSNMRSHQSSKRCVPRVYNRKM